MKTFAICAAFFAALAAGDLGAAEISSPALAKMGLAGVHGMSDRQGLQVRASPTLVGSLDGGAMRVVFAHFIDSQYNNLPASGFAARGFTPLRLPTGGSGGRPR